ncbi:HAD-superfamily subfamily IB hydrolase, TIGR01490 [Cellulomonas flavigena DSM 20109]|uniref:HAD-superfamily subfamily IB hydrolase, TIGR01490 n=1 Tax=Cellulomonas flavigena (strain ATCC 482 / DSM 20109 / BCRC 11376 / JCM 18109 / NBRC 3775 / NCIMB 8073 / NRS 134) TaxID=446466 RepID=D5UJP7_CELFN|nr:HAD family hydrolase [Cellulomonas flavigena]ADG75685.1 HAD-superfamily subfamily IB hydrolase, TIGR01490 [Cellulomonas flavigena DSM 20109]
MAHHEPAGTGRARPRRARVAAFFDLDKTIIATSSATAFSKGFLAEGLLTRRSVVASAYAQLAFLLGGADETATERLRAALSRAVVGWDVAQVSTIVRDTLHESIDPTVYAEAVELIAHHHAAGHDVVVVSASGAEVVEPIAEMLGADAVIATRMAVAEGRYTGEIDFYAYGENKAVAIRGLAAERGYDLDACFAYSDSVTDAPMLAAVGHAHVVNPDRALRRLAAEHGWEALTFRRPVPLRRLDTRIRVTTGSVLAGVALVVLALWWWRRRRRPA